MDERLLEAFRGAAMSTFKDMFGIDAAAEPPVELAVEGEHGWDLTGLVGIAGQVQGVVAFRLTVKLATALLARSGVEVSGGAEDRALQSGLVGEVTNIIAGGASSALSGYDFDIAPPVVIRGPGHKISWPAIGPVVGIAFATAEGAFEIDLCAKV